MHRAEISDFLSLPEKLDAAFEEMGQKLMPVANREERDSTERALIDSPMERRLPRERIVHRGPAAEEEDSIWGIALKALKALHPSERWEVIARPSAGA